MASDNYLQKRKKALSERNSKRGKLGNEAKRRMMKERGEVSNVVGGFTTFGCMGDHTVELLDCGDEVAVWIRVDGEIRAPRTIRGVRAVLAKWIVRDVCKLNT